MSTFRSIYKGFIYVIQPHGEGWKFEVSEDFKTVAANEGYKNIALAELAVQDAVNNIIKSENENAHNYE